MKTVFIGIVTYNSRADLTPCFAALRQQTYPHLHITVLDNHSQDESVAWLQAHEPDVPLIINLLNVGFARGHNRILREITLGEGDYYLALNPDVVLRPDYIETLVSALEAQGAGWGTGLLLSTEEPPIIYSAGHAMRRDGYAFHIGHKLCYSAGAYPSREIFGASGAACLISQRLIAALAKDGALYDEQMFLYYEDTDLDWRARRLGWKCWYTAEAVAIHRGSQPDLALQTQALGNRFLSILKNAYLIDLFIYNLPLMVLHCLLRLFLTPRSGLQLMFQVMRDTPATLRKRRKPVMPRRKMLRWMRWSQQQPPTDQYSLMARLKRLLRISGLG